MPRQPIYNPMKPIEEGSDTVRRREEEALEEGKRRHLRREEEAIEEGKRRQLRRERGGN